jgi:hypothetical protein
LNKIEEYTVEKKRTMSSVLKDSLFEPKALILGIIGHSNCISEADLHDQIILPLLQEIERVPDKILLPSEGNSSIYLQEWAETLSIATQVFHSDWSRNGKLAQIIRDDRIQKECTHGLVFLSKRSTRLEKMAEKLVKKEKVVFTSSHNRNEVQLERWLHSSKASTHAHKSNKETGQMLLKFQKKE